MPSFLLNGYPQMQGGSHLGPGAEALYAHLQAAGLDPGPEVAENCQQQAQIEEKVEGTVCCNQGKGQQEQGRWKDYGQG